MLSKKASRENTTADEGASKIYCILKNSRKQLSRIAYSFYEKQWKFPKQQKTCGVRLLFSNTTFLAVGLQLMSMNKLQLKLEKALLSSNIISSL